MLSTRLSSDWKPRVSMGVACSCGRGRAEVWGERGEPSVGMVRALVLAEVEVPS